MLRHICQFLLPGIVFVSCACNESVKSEIDDTGTTPAPVISLLDQQACDKKLTPLTFITTVKAVTLQSSEDANSIIARAEKIIHAGGKYVIFDNRFYGLKVFNEEGKFLYRIGKTGKGPGEYTRINDVELVNHDALAVLADNMNMIYYNLEGDYLRSKRTGFFATDFEILHNNSFFFYTNNNVSDKSKSHNLLQTDSNFSIVQRYFKINSRREVPSFEFTGSLVKGDNALLYAEAFSDRIFSFDKDHFKTEYKLDFEGRLLPDKLKTDPQLFIKQGAEYDYISRNILDSKDFLFATCLINKRLDHMIYDKSNGRFNMISNVDMQDDYLAKLFSTPVGSDNQSLFMSITPEMIEYLKESESGYLELLSRKNPQLYAVLTKPQIPENPLLLVCDVNRNAGQAKR